MSGTLSPRQKAYVRKKTKVHDLDPSEAAGEHGRAAGGVGVGDGAEGGDAVSYTHLTLPTSDLV